MKITIEGSVNKGWTAEAWFPQYALVRSKISPQHVLQLFLDEFAGIQERKRQLDAKHPADVLHDEFMLPCGFEASDVDEAGGMTKGTTAAVLRCEIELTGWVAEGMARAFGQGVEFWEIIHMRWVWNGESTGCSDSEVQRAAEQPAKTPADGEQRS